MISIARPMTGVSMKLSTRPRSEAVLGLEPETSYMNVQMGSCDPRSRKNTETRIATWMQTCACSQMRSCERGAGNCIEIHSVFSSYQDRELQSLISCRNIEAVAYSEMENSGGRSEINVTDGRGSSRTIAASFFILFSITQVLLQYYLIRLFKLHSNLFGAFTTH